MGKMGTKCPKSRPSRQRILIGIAASLLILIILILIIHFATKGENPSLGWQPQCLSGQVDDFMIPVVNCHPDRGVTEDKCKKRGCCWLDLSSAISSYYPKCVYPKNYGYEAMKGKEESFANGRVIKLKRIESVNYWDDIRFIALRIEEQTPYRLRIKYYDPNEERFEIPESILPIKQNSKIKDPFKDTLYAVSYDKSEVPFNLKVRRTNNHLTIFNTSLGGFTFSNQFIQLTTTLPPKSHIYGLGGLSRPLENHLSNSIYSLSRSNTKWQTWTLFTSGNGKLEDGHNSHGAHPMYLCVEQNGNAHGLLFLNSYPMDVQHQPSPAMSFYTIGGVIDIYLFLGPTPKDVIEQYTEIVGRPFMPPYWALGLHLHLPNLRFPAQATTAIKFMNSHNLTFDSVILDANIVDLRTNYLIKNLTSQLKERGQEMILSVHPGIDDTDLTKQGFVKDYLTRKSLQTQVDLKIVMMPDFGNSKAASMWERRLKELYTKVSFAGLKLERNEPYTSITGSLNGCSDVYYNNPPYVPRVIGNSLNNNTICMDAIHTWGSQKLRHLEVHNLYGHSMLKTTANVLTSFQEKKRFLLLSRSTFAGSGSYGGHWFSRSSALFHSSHIKLSIISILEYNLLGIPYVGESVCNGTDQALCQRSIHLGMFYPFVEFPFVFGDAKSTLRNDVVKRVTRLALETRYSLLPYLYTLFHEAHTKGSLVVRPLFYEFPYDKISTGYFDNQFMWGPALLVSPHIHWEINIFHSFFPKGKWYDFYKGLEINSTGSEKSLIKSTDRINLHIRGGYIIPMQTSWNNTFLSRQKPLHLVVALDHNQRAKGYLYWDDGITRNAYENGEYVITSFEAVNNTLRVFGKKGEGRTRYDFEKIEFRSVNIFGLQSQPDYVTIDDGLLVEEQLEWQDKILKLKNIKIPITREVVITWNWKDANK